MNFRHAAPPPGYRRGVGTVLFNREGLVFAARRADAPDAWQMPQGGIDAGEAPHAAALRELAEETGTGKAEIVAETAGWLSYDLPPALAATIWKGAYRGQAQKWFALRFLGTDADIDLDADEHPEFVEWRWLPLADLPRLIIPFKRPLYDAVVAELGPAIHAAAPR